MKSLALTLLSSLFLCSCSSLSKNKGDNGEGSEEAAPLEGGSIPPPMNLELIKEGGEVSENKLPDVNEAVADPLKGSEVKKASNTTQTGDFVFRDALETLPSSRDIDVPIGTPPATAPETAPTKLLNSEGLQQGETKPLVSNP